ncbi:MAG: glutathione S-transferase family protein [Verrucomicrobiales bacterium]|nr:glutathione S-transferase family protein [Verrucomicrobiales bacterium]
MIRFHQFDWSPYCLVVRGILEAGGAPFRVVDVPLNDRSSIWRLTKERYYQVPVIQDGKNVLFETSPDSQVLAKYLDSKFGFGLFPREWEGVQPLLWRFFENDVEDVAFRLNDIHWKEFVPRKEQCGFLRHKERRFGRGCLEAWRVGEAGLLGDLERLLAHPEEMLATRDFLLCDRPVFVDFCLRGMLANFLYSGHYVIPESRPRLRAWMDRMKSVKLRHLA